MKIAMASDHAAFDYKTKLASWLKEDEHQILDFGCFSEESVDYPDFAFPAAESVASNVADLGIVICGSGIGMSIICNKVAGIRSANCVSPEMARLARQHNNANILNFGARIVSLDTAKEMIKEFLYSEFEGGRHMIRVEKIHSLSGW